MTDFVCLIAVLFGFSKLLYIRIDYSCRSQKRPLSVYNIAWASPFYFTSGPSGSQRALSLSYNFQHHLLSLLKLATMCIQVIERYAVCKCLHHRHSVDPCERHGHRGHGATEKVILVGFICPRHTPSRQADTTNESQSTSGGNRPWHDSGYSSGGYQSGGSNRR